MLTTQIYLPLEFLWMVGYACNVARIFHVLECDILGLTVLPLP
jgi:hypothetical protein